MDMDRRGFLKLMGGLVALPVVGKVFKFSKKAVETAPKVLKEQGMPDFFYDLVAGVKKFGKKKGSGRDYDVYEFTDPKTKRKVEVIDSRDEVGVSFETDKGFRGEMGVKKGMPDEMTKGKTPPDEYYEGEEVYRSIGGDGYTKDFEEGISGGYQGLEELSKRIGKSGGGAVGQPPVYETNSPSEAAKEIISRVPFLGGSGEVIPIYDNQNTNIEAYLGSPQDNVRYGLGAFTSRGDLFLNELNNGNRQIGAEFGTTATPNTTFAIGYTEGQGPQFGLQYRRQFNSGGVTSGPPPEKGPNSQGLESLFQTR